MYERRRCQARQGREKRGQGVVEAAGACSGYVCILFVRFDYAKPSTDGSSAGGACLEKTTFDLQSLPTVGEKLYLYDVDQFSPTRTFLSSEILNRVVAMSEMRTTWFLSERVTKVLFVTGPAEKADDESAKRSEGNGRDRHFGD